MRDQREFPNIPPEVPEWEPEESPEFPPDEPEWTPESPDEPAPEAPPEQARTTRPDR